MLNEGLKNFLENKTVRQYFEACLAMQSPEVTELFRQLPPSIGLSSPVLFTAELVKDLEVDGLVLSDDALEAMASLAVRLTENCSDRRSTIVDFRKMEYDILAHRDLSILMSGLLSINNIAEQDLANQVSKNKSDEQDSVKVERQ